MIDSDAELARARALVGRLARTCDGGHIVGCAAQIHDGKSKSHQRMVPCQRAVITVSPVVRRTSDCCWSGPLPSSWSPGLEDAMQALCRDRHAGGSSANRREVLGAFGGIAAALATGPILTKRAAAQETLMVEEPWSAGGLAGSFVRPRHGPPRGPAVLILAGSGGTPRDGNYRTYLQLAQGLGAAGIRSLRYD